MTILALIAVSFAVHVIGLMAGIAVGWRRVVVELALVAGPAIRADVFAIQRKLRVAIVVEELRLPLVGIVTIATLGTEASLVHVRADMAGGAVAGRLLEPLVGVAQTACHVFVCSLEAELGGVVVEGRLLPVRILVTGRAILAEASAVHIVALVAGNTFETRLAMLLFCDMAIGTRNRHVGALQRVVRKAVIEGRGIQPHDIRLPAPVVRVTAATRRCSQAWREAMKPLACCEIGTHILMATEAEPILCGTVEGAVTARALLFEFRRTLDHRTRHQQGLGVRSTKPGRKKPDEQEGDQDTSDQNRCTASTWTAAAPKSRNASGR